ncbi:MAG: class I SAM-dependent methyltransferase, partial [Anaerolineales bacterium]|nr:class I SAM-dependent methyltransferase [Anaerolineales bacterium]
MTKTTRNLIKRYLPKRWRYSLQKRVAHQRMQRAKKSFSHAPTEPAYLDFTAFEMLQATYPLEPFEYTYDQETVEKRARHYVAEIKRTFPTGAWSQMHRFLDLGAWDGTVCQILAEAGHTAVGLDIRTEGYLPPALASTATLTQMDVSQLALPDNYFDCVFSFNSFEHFPRPDLALAEAIRVTKPNGYIYVNFGPLWWSAKGAHQFRTISIPYCQCLFSPEQLQTYATQKNIDLMGFHWMNEWSIEQYRQLWQSHTSHLKTIAYYEEYEAR